MRRFRTTGVAASALLLAVAVAACGSSSSGSSSGGGGGPSGLTAPTADLPVPTSIGTGEGQLNLIAWEGYTQPLWVKPFEQKTGCQVRAKYAGSSSEMVSLLADGGGGQYDMVSASGDADLRLIYAGDVRPINPDLVPQIKNFHSFLQAPAFNTIDGKHYGTSLQFGPNVLLYNTDDFSTAPTSWSTIYDKKYSGKISVPDNPIQIADAALYLSKTQPDLGITDPYELTQPQFDASVNLLKQQQPLVKKYWGLASQEVSLFKTGSATIGAAWPYQTSLLLDAKAPVADTIPKEGATGWADSWLMATKAPHTNCAYMWMDYITSPKAQALQATWYGETPANKLACPIMDKLVKGSCSVLHANAPQAYYDTIKFWKTPLAQCGNGQNNCVPYSKWTTAWTTITG
ncbi:MAG: ABC transporter substrate-binding protein [Frankiaceae bacterium]|nr:ABC transporter substrate-binding protein [Frankiaceae bacterium]MBV9869636.1 ABC transporter substrate-binding protein [Frankiaceae bacterium]